MMSNKPHLRPHQKKRHANRMTRLLVGILIVAVFVLVIALELTGHIVFRGRLAMPDDEADLSAGRLLVRGAAHHLDTEAERAAVIGAGLEPWIDGVPAHFIRVSPTGTWGNRVLRA
jgi:hypothetical protein